MKVQKEKLKSRNRGITLIALVITIIVLLILAGISISMLSGDNSILNRAVEAKEKNKESAAYEQLDLVKMAWISEERTNNNANVENFLQEQKEKGEIDSFTKEKDNKTYTITKNGYSRTIETPTYYTITKIYEDKTETQKVKGEDITGLVTYREKTGYYFAGWSKDENDFSKKGSFLMGRISSNLTVYPKYVSDEIYLHDIKFVWTDGSNSSFLAFAVDSNILRKVGVMATVNRGEKTITKHGYLVGSLKLIGNTYTTQSLFGVEGALAVLDFKISEIDFEINDRVELTPYLITYDGVTVEGKVTTTFIYTGNGQFEKQ